MEGPSGHHGQPYQGDVTDDVQQAATEEGARDLEPHPTADWHVQLHTGQIPRDGGKASCLHAVERTYHHGRTDHQERGLRCGCYTGRHQLASHTKCITFLLVLVIQR